MADDNKTAYYMANFGQAVPPAPSGSKSSGGSGGGGGSSPNVSETITQKDQNSAPPPKIDIERKPIERTNLTTGVTEKYGGFATGGDQTVDKWISQKVLVPANIVEYMSVNLNIRPPDPTDIKLYGKEKYDKAWAEYLAIAKQFEGRGLGNQTAYSDITEIQTRFEPRPQYRDEEGGGLTHYLSPIKNPPSNIILNEDIQPLNPDFTPRKEITVLANGVESQYLVPEYRSQFSAVFPMRYSELSADQRRTLDVARGATPNRFNETSGQFEMFSQKGAQEYYNQIKNQDKLEFEATHYTFLGQTIENPSLSMAGFLGGLGLGQKGNLNKVSVPILGTAPATALDVGITALPLLGAYVIETPMGVGRWMQETVNQQSGSKLLKGGVSGLFKANQAGLERIDQGLIQKVNPLSREFDPYMTGGILIAGVIPVGLKGLKARTGVEVSLAEAGNKLGTSKLELISPARGLKPNEYGFYNAEEIAKAMKPYNEVKNAQTAIARSSRNQAIQNAVDKVWINAPERITVEDIGYFLRPLNPAEMGKGIANPNVNPWVGIVSNPKAQIKTTIETGYQRELFQEPEIRVIGGAKLPKEITNPPYERPELFSDIKRTNLGDRTGTFKTTLLEERLVKTEGKIRPPSEAGGLTTEVIKVIPPEMVSASARQFKSFATERPMDIAIEITDPKTGSISRRTGTRMVRTETRYAPPLYDEYSPEASKAKINQPVELEITSGYVPVKFKGIGKGTASLERLSLTHGQDQIVPSVGSDIRIGVYERGKVTPYYEANPSEILPKSSRIEEISPRSEYSISGKIEGMEVSKVLSKKGLRSISWKSPEVVRKFGRYVGVTGGISEPEIRIIGGGPDIGTGDIQRMVSGESKTVVSGGSKTVTQEALAQKQAQVTTAYQVISSAEKGGGTKASSLSLSKSASGAIERTAPAETYRVMPMELSYEAEDTYEGVVSAQNTRGSMKLLNIQRPEMGLRQSPETIARESTRNLESSIQVSKLMNQEIPIAQQEVKTKTETRQRTRTEERVATISPVISEVTGWSFPKNIVPNFPIPRNNTPPPPPPIIILPSNKPKKKGTNAGAPSLGFGSKAKGSRLRPIYTLGEVDRLVRERGGKAVSMFEPKDTAKNREIYRKSLLGGFAVSGLFPKGKGKRRG